MLGANCGGSSETLVGERGRHPDVDYGNVRTLRADNFEEFSSCAAPPHYLQSGEFQE